jgi:Ni,Fe-hydrogenase maturation factor
MQLPKDDDILIVAVEAEDVLTFGEQCTPQVASALPGAVQTVIDEIARFQSRVPPPGNGVP